MTIDKSLRQNYQIGKKVDSEKLIKEYKDYEQQT